MKQSFHSIIKKIKDRFTCLNISSYLIIYRILLHIFTKRNGKKKKIKRTVCVYRRGGIGDWAIFQESLQVLYDIFPEELYDVILIGDIRFEEFKFLAGRPLAFESINQHLLRSSIKYKYNLLKKIRGASCDIWIDADVVLSKAGLLFLCAASPREVAFALHATHIGKCKAKANEIQKKYFTVLVKTDCEKLHEFSRLQELMKAIASYYSKNLVYPIKETQYYPAQASIVFFVGASSTNRCWPMQRFVSVVESLLDRKYKIIILGMQPVEDSLDKIFPSHVLDLRGMTTPKELVEYISRATLVVTTDSAALHIAAYFDRPTVTIAPGAHFTRYCDYGGNVISVHAHDTSCFDCDWKCIHPYSHNGLPPCVENISIEQVIAAVRSLMCPPQKNVEFEMQNYEEHN